MSADGKGLVSGAGGQLLAETLRATGLGSGLSQGLVRWRPGRAVHDPGKVIADLAVAVALGGGCLPRTETYRADTYQLIRTGLSGGKGIPATVATHPAVFVTLTAPSFGTVHARRERNGRVLPCRSRRKHNTCERGLSTACTVRHGRNDTQLSNHRERIGCGVSIREACGEHGTAFCVVVRLEHASPVVANGHERPRGAPAVEVSHYCGYKGVALPLKPTRGPRLSAFRRNWMTVALAGGSQFDQPSK